MKKVELLRLLSNKHKLPLGKTQDLLEDFFGFLTAALARGEMVDFRGFGTFLVREARARKGRNIKKGEEVSIPARRVPTLRPGKTLVSRCNGKADKMPAQAASTTPTAARPPVFQRSRGM
ncbi:MAG TPA: HU family DNA-binding protein [Pseudomonadota bacterium]|jgi:nucleoid DNA-binding protein|nr:HU family DNA-binding protein [Pseudomonadota bacterium]